MNAVIGFSDLLLGTELSPQQRARAAGIRSAGQSLLRIIDDILDVARIEAGRMSLIRKPIDLRSMLADVRNLLEPLAGAKRLALSLEIDPEVPAAVLGDEGRLRQILLNLGNNAVKFTERGEVRLALRARQTGRGAVQLRFGVSDTGIGMSGEQIARLFAPFVQLDASSTRRHGGTGLGLHIARQFAELMGGALEVQSSPGRGSEFELRLTLRIAPAVAAQRTAAIAPECATLSLLLVEDNEVNREVARAILETAGHRVQVACDGAEALQLYGPGRFDCVLMDCQMPGVDGFEATQRIRQREAASGAARRVPIVALTANAMREDRERCLAAGMDDFLAKPFDAAALLAAASRWARRPATTPSSFDPAMLEDLMQVERDKPGFLARLARTFLENTPELIASVAEASDAAPQEAQRAAHSLKSTSARFGARALAGLAAQAEAAAREGKLEDARTLAGAMREEFARAADLMQRHPAISGGQPHV
jgi:CheY-like chemotaxis protein/HPt (histidine-containing phosphotransfer) domain-containing protein